MYTGKTIFSQLDIGIAHAVAEIATDEDIQQMESFLKKLKQKINDIEEYLSLAIEFHQQLALATKNTIF